MAAAGTPHYRHYINRNISVGEAGVIVTGPSVIRYGLPPYKFTAADFPCRNSSNIRAKAFQLGTKVINGIERPVKRLAALHFSFC